jgi:hypothetical protein
MRRLCFFLSILTLAALLAGCAPKASAQPEQVKALENPTLTALPEKSALIGMATSEVVSHDPPASCPTTVPQNPPFMPPAPYNTLEFQGEFLFGSKNLWTAIPTDAIWYSLPHNPNGYSQKVVWWRDGYVWTEEPEPALTVTGERLDAVAPPLNVSKATNAYASDIGSAMLVGIDLPTLGCWKITGKYSNTELSFVVWVAP